VCSALGHLTKEKSTALSPNGSAASLFCHRASLCIDRASELVSSPINDRRLAERRLTECELTADSLRWGRTEIGTTTEDFAAD
jgi:hypothetical protein